MDYKTLQENRGKYYVSNGIPCSFVTKAMLTDEDEKIEAFITDGVYKEAEKRRTLLRDAIDEFFEYLQANGVLCQKPNVPLVTDFYKEVIAEYGLDGTRMEGNPNNRAIFSITENDGLTSITQLSFAQTATCASKVLENPNCKTGVREVAYLYNAAKYNNIDILAEGSSENDSQKKDQIDRLQKKLIDFLTYDQSFLTGPTRDLGINVIRYKLRELGYDIAPYSFDVRLQTDDTGIDTVEVNCKKVPFEKNMESDNNHTVVTPPQQPPVEPPVVPTFDEPDLSSHSFQSVSFADDDSQSFDSSQETEDALDEPDLDSPGFPNDSIADEPQNFDSNTPSGEQVEGVKSVKKSLFERLFEKGAQVVDNIKASMKKAQADAKLPDSEILRQIEEARMMSGGEITPTLKYWENILCMKRGEPLKYPDIYPEQEKEELESEETPEPIMELSEEQKARLTQLEADQNYLEGLIEQYQDGLDVANSIAKFKDCIQEIERERAEILAQSKVVEEEQVEDAHQGTEPQTPEDLPTSQDKPEEETTIKIDFLVSQLKAAIARSDVEDIYSLFSLIKYKFPYETTKRYVDKIEISYNQGNIDNALSLIDQLENTVPGREAQLSEYEKRPTKTHI